MFYHQMKLLMQTIKKQALLKNERHDEKSKIFNSN